MPKKYTEQENAYIREHHREMNYVEIAEHLGRSVRGVRNQALRLGLSRLKRWTTEEDCILFNNVGNPQTGVAKRLGRSVSEVSTRWKKIGQGRPWASGHEGYATDGRGRPVVGWKRRSGKSSRIMLHRYNMEQHLGRELSSCEIVHHINGDKKECGIENLYLCTSRSDHHCVHHSFDALLPELMKCGMVGFDREEGVYYVC